MPCTLSSTVVWHHISDVRRSSTGHYGRGQVGYLLLPSARETCSALLQEVGRLRIRTTRTTTEVAIGCRTKLDTWATNGACAVAGLESRMHMGLARRHSISGGLRKLVTDHAAFSVSVRLIYQHSMARFMLTMRTRLHNAHTLAILNWECWCS